MEENGHMEEFFRRRLNSQEFAFQEDDWLKMEQKLDAAGLASKTDFVRSPVKLIIIILAALTAAFILGWMTNELVSKNQTNTVSQKDESDVFAAHRNSGPGFESTNDVSAPVSDQKLSSYKDSDSTHYHRYVTSTSQVISESVKSAPNTELTAEIHAEGLDLQKSIQLPALTTAENEDNFNSRILTTGHELNRKSPLTGHLSIAESGKMIRVPDNSRDLGSMNKNGLSGRLTIGLAIAPDFNSTGLLNRKSMTPAAGGVITYALSQRWSVTARIFYNNKKYRSSADYYHVPYNYWQNRTNGVVPETIDGSCRVIDVPIMFNYEFLQKRSFYLTASAGLGSYFLLDEKYKFTFSADNPGAATEWTTSENSQSYFNVINLAMGLSLRTGPKTSFVLEPYMKIPIKQMGWAKVNLSGVGLSVMFNYHF